MRTPSRDHAALYVGCAGWTISKIHRAKFPAEGSHLARYASRLPAVEINSSFYKPHRPATYARWADSVPPTFRFAIKAPKAITHLARLVGAEEQLATFLNEVLGLGDKLGPLLVQLPPSLEFAPTVADAFFAAVRRRFDGNIVCEPRHASWFTAESEALLVRFHVARAAADPAVVPAAAEPGGWPGIVYYRLHGSPDCYYSAYSAEYLVSQSQKLQRVRASGAPAWCIFDNTAAGAATADALSLIALVNDHSGASNKALDPPD
jgi:uncharacterized protein YecE (DUF72 family)